MQQIRRDTIKIARHNKLNIDTMSYKAANADTGFVQANKESYQAVMSGAYVHPKPAKVLTAFDTIVPCNLSLYPTATPYILKSQPVRNPQEMEMPMNYDVLFNGVVLSFTLWMSAKYLMSCGAAWSNLIQDLRNELS
jgi:hypothetical protein